MKKTGLFKTLMFVLFGIILLSWIFSASYFTEVRTTRNSSRNQQLAQINEVIASSTDGSEAKNEAIAMKIKLTTIMEQENLLESLIKGIWWIFMSKYNWIEIIKLF